MLGEYPTYEEREKAKQKCDEILYDQNSTIHGKASAVVNLKIQSHYWRAREELESMKNHKKFLKKIRGKDYFSGYILDIDHYIPHWLFSMGESLAPEILECIKKQYHYQPKECKYLPKVSTVYRQYETRRRWV